MRPTEFRTTRRRHRFLGLLTAVGLVLLSGCSKPATPLANATPSSAATKERLFISGYGGLHIVDPVAEKVVTTLPMKGGLREMAFTPDQRRLYVTSDRHLIYEVDTVAEKTLGTFNLTDDSAVRTIYGIAAGHNPRQLYLHYTRHIVAKDHYETMPDELGIYDLDQKKLVKTMTVPAGVHQLIPMKDGRLAAFGQDYYVIDLQKMEIVETKGLHHPGTDDKNKPTDYMWFWPRNAGQEGKLATAPVFLFGPGPQDMAGGLLSFNPADGKLDITEMGPPEGYFSSVLSPDGKWLYQTFNYTTKTDMETKKQVAHVDNPRGSSYGINISPDGKRVYLSGAGADVTILNAGDLSVRKIIDLPTDSMDIRVAQVPAQ